MMSDQEALSHVHDHLANAVLALSRLESHVHDTDTFLKIAQLLTDAQGMLLRISRSYRPLETNSSADDGQRS